MTSTRWAFGFGARLVTPTAADALGSGKWQIMPGFGVRYSFLEFGSDTYFVPKLRYAASFAGDPTRRPHPQHGRTCQGPIYSSAKMARYCPRGRRELQQIRDWMFPAHHCQQFMG
ncbi:MAG: hypothetical protein ACLPTZ_21555 [Beijerinckiaceae bacterium]